MKELALLILALAMTFGARAVMEVAWYRYRSRATPKKSRIGWGPDSIGLPRPIFFAVAAGLLLAAIALLGVVGVQFGLADVLGLIFLALCAVLLIGVATALAVIWGKWVARYWWGQASRNGDSE